MSIAIIGAGMTGLSCARLLADHGRAPVVFEKSRGLGGRLATKRIDALRFDHGAQFVTARGDSFRNHLNTHAAPWRPDGANEWFVGIPAMNDLVKPLAKGLDIRFGEKVTPQRAENGWTVGGMFFERIISTVPVAQAQDLFPDMAAALDTVRVTPCWTLMVAFRKTPEWPVMWRKRETDLSWIARNTSKPQRPAEPDCWIAHASQRWSEVHLEVDKDIAKDHMLDLLRSMLGTTPEVVHAAAHRWRYALTTVPLGVSHITTPDEKALIGGDWCLGARAEDAWNSGQAMARALLSVKD